MKVRLYSWKMCANCKDVLVRVNELVCKKCLEGSIAYDYICVICGIDVREVFVKGAKLRESAKQDICSKCYKKGANNGEDIQI